MYRMNSEGHGRVLAVSRRPICLDTYQILDHASIR